MDWLTTFFAALLAVVLVSPLLMLLTTVFILAPLIHLAPPPPMTARRTSGCWISTRRVNAEFLTTPELDWPGDVLSYSAFPDGRVFWNVLPLKRA